MDMHRPKRGFRAAALGMAALWLAACTPLTPAPEREAEPVPMPAPAPQAPAVVALADTAQEFEAQGRYDSAAAALERALRLSPQDAELWHRLAGIRLVQGRWPAAESLAFRSLGLDATNALRRANWLLIADARRAAGNEAGAREAEARAE